MRLAAPYPRPFVLALVALFAAAHPALSQQSGEPILDQVREVFSQPGLAVGFLFQSVLDPGLDGQRARASVANARLIARGGLDEGFSYMLQTNFAAAPSLLDASVSWSTDPRFQAPAGRFKTSFSQELLTFGGALDFVNRSRVVSALAPNRQMGAQVSGVATDQVSWAFGGFTSGTNATPNESLAGVGRLRVGGIEVGEGALSVAGHVGFGRDGAIGAGQQGTGYVGDGRLLGVEGRYEGGRLLLAGELIRADWDPAAGADMEADGLYLTGGWLVRPNQQALLRWDRYRAPGGASDNVLVFGYNAWPTSAAKIQVNLLAPLRDSATPNTLLVNFQIGF